MAYPDEVLADSPRHYWRLGDGPSPYAPSAGAIDLSREHVSGPDAVAGALAAGDDGAAQFNGTSQSLRATAVDLSDTDTISVELWLWWDAYANNDDMVLDYGPGSPTSHGGFFIDPNSTSSGGAFGIALYPGPVNGSFFENTFPRPSAAAWHHIVAVMDKGLTPALGAIRLYVDGVEQTATSVNAPNKAGELFGGPLNLHVMSRDLGALFGAGRVDELALYPFALSEARIGAHYGAGSGVAAAQALTAGGALASAEAFGAGELVQEIAPEALQLFGGGHLASAAAFGTGFLEGGETESVLIAIASLPFPYTAQLERTGGEVAESGIRMAVWPARVHRAERAGRYYELEGEARPQHYEALRQPNRVLRVQNGPYVGLYRIVDVQVHLHGIKHCSLELTRTGN